MKRLSLLLAVGLLGACSILPQDLPVAVAVSTIRRVKGAHPVFDSPVAFSATIVMWV